MKCRICQERDIKHQEVKMCRRCHSNYLYHNRPSHKKDIDELDNARYTALRCTAKRKGRELRIKRKDYIKYIRANRDCVYCDNPAFGISSPNYGLDRVDNSKGYTWDNVVVCCKGCNTTKGNRKWDKYRTRSQVRKWRKNDTYEEWGI